MDTVKRLLIVALLAIPSLCFAVNYDWYGGGSASEWDIEDDFSSDTSADFTAISSHSITVSGGAAHGESGEAYQKFYHETSVGGSDQVVQADLGGHNSSYSDGAGIVVRYNPTNDTGYYVYRDADDLCLASISSGGTEAWIKCDWGGFTNASYTIRVEISGTSIDVYADDVITEISVTNSTYSTGNYCGVGFDRNSGQDIDVTVDNLKAKTN